MSLPVRDREPTPFCKHRWTIVKRFEIKNDWFAIRRCRYCDQWHRIKIEIGENSVAIKPKRTIEKFDE